MAATTSTKANALEQDWDAADRAAEGRTGRRWSNRRLLAVLVAIGLFMFGFAYANVPLFDMLCRAMGISFNPNAASTETIEPGALGREITVSFTGSIIGTLPVSFAPARQSMTVRLGEQALVDYHFVNMSSRKVYFRPVHSVQPSSVADDQFSLSECFCFDDQYLNPRQDISLPVVFRISPDIPADVNRVQLHYTLFPITEAEYQPPGQGRKAKTALPEPEAQTTEATTP